jgi:hypothetical protein
LYSVDDFEWVWYRDAWRAAAGQRLTSLACTFGDLFGLCALVCRAGSTPPEVTRESLHVCIVLAQRRGPRFAPPDILSPIAAVHKQDVRRRKVGAQKVRASSPAQIARKDRDRARGMGLGVCHSGGASAKELRERLVFAMDPQALRVKLRHDAYYYLLVASARLRSISLGFRI